MTVNDNAFTNVLVKYLNNKVFNLTLDLMDKANSAQDKAEADSNNTKLAKRYKQACNDYRDAEAKLKGIFNPTRTSQLTEEESQFLKERLITSFDYYCKRYNKPEELLGKLEVEITESFTDRHENGKALYWLHTSKVMIIQ